MTRPRPRLGHDLDGFGALRSALVAYRMDPRDPLARAEAIPTTTGPLPGPRTAPSAPDPGADTPAFETTAEGLEVVELVARAQAGDGDAFGLLYDRYVDLVYRYVYYRVGTQSLAEDLVSETFLRALRRISSFSWQGRDFAAWLVTIARNLIADHFKSGRYRLEVATEDMLTIGDGPSVATTEGEVIDTLTNQTLLEAVKQLNSEQQECVVLRFLQGLSVTETALAMGKTEGAIKALQYRAVRTLGRMLPKELML